MNENITMKNPAIGNILAKGVRVITVPPVLITGMLVILTVSLDNFCSSMAQMILAVLLLGLVPILAYPIQKLLPSKGEVREEQRNLAFILTFAGYLHVRASGHACSVTGTLYFLSFFLGAAAIIPCVCIAAAVVWSSLRLKRHTIQEIFWGSAVCLPCILASVFIL